MEVVENVGAEAPASAPVIADTTPAVAPQEPAAPAETPEARDAQITDELSAVWDKQFTNGVEKGPDGRFISKNPAEAKQSDGPAKAEANTAADNPVDPAALPPVIPPAHLTADQKAKFATWPREAQEHFVEVEKAREAVYTRKDQETAELRKTAEPLLKAIEPFQNYLQQLAPIIGQTPDRLISSVLATEYTLRTGTPEQKRQAALGLLASYQIDLATDAGQYGQPDPRVAQLEQVVSQLQYQLTARQQQEQEQQVASVAAQVQEFSKDKAYFAEVQDEMLGLVPILQRKHPEASHKEILAKAYDAAIHANPFIRERVLAEQRKAMDDKQREEAAKRAEEARKSGKVNVRSGTAQPTPKTMDDDLEEIARRAYG